MSEQEPNHEKRLTNVCAKCEKEFPLSEENAQVTLFLDLPQCTFLFSVCSHCETPEVLFIAVDGNTAEQCANNGIPVDIEEITPEDVRQLYEELTGKVPEAQPEPTPQLETPELDWISPRKEHQIKSAVGFLIYLAENGRL